MSLKHHGRFDYVPITKRRDFTWPEGKRLAVYFGINLEHFAFGEGRGAQLVPGDSQPDVLNYAWREYGNRVGAWRMIEMFDALGLPATVLANSEMYDHAPELMEAHRARGDEIAGHGRTNSERQDRMPEAEERALIAEATDVLAQAEGRPPEGWLSPWIAESVVTPDLLVEAGYRYTLNWCMDDQPIWMRTRSGLLLSIPYPQEVNDIPSIVARQDPADIFAEMILGDFEERLEQSRSQSLVMGIALHPYIVGQPYRLRALRRVLERICAARDDIWITRAGDISRICHGPLRDIIA
ncbi:polysaccharide deacetylase [Roseivivax halodurans JCM 10272]|uniref:Chitooligosaccharide deacetylase n=1 Tax=Roseivivax halodurans JCM 10272 TaxID=1449350 RepID=X7EMA1_9RHOB|nr:polysaccharide deacetylase family protein [Roseivivax halodurans]ETX16283.1 polysaccharide deacetylase [Roseivivax halodurans JCM 10272]